MFAGALKMAVGTYERSGDLIRHQFSCEAVVKLNLKVEKVKGEQRSLSDVSKQDTAHFLLPTDNFNQFI